MNKEIHGGAVRCAEKPFIFGLLTQRIEGNPSPYFVCQRCGSTLTQIPQATCPICKGPAAEYKEIKWKRLNAS